ncbi:MAG: rod shape-determining protein MreC [Patescibacteria group bacterium]
MRSVSRKDQINLLLIAVFLSFLLLIFESLGVLRIIYPYVYRIKSPFVLVGVELSQLLLTPFRVVRTSHKAHRRVQDLERNYSESLAQISQLEGMEQENKYLRSLLGSSDIKAGKTIIVRSVSAYGQPAIMLPSNETLRIGNPVLISGAIIGRISELEYSQAKLSLLSKNNPESLLLAKTQNDVNGVIKGDGKRVLFTEVLRSKQLQVGDRVSTQGQEGVASNLFIGKIQQIIEDNSSPVQTAVLEQIASFYESTLVEVRLE